MHKYRLLRFKIYGVKTYLEIQGDPREPDIFWMGSTQNCAEEEQTVPTCGFNNMVPQRTLQTSHWPLFETCFPFTSFPVSETCRGPLALPIFQRVVFFSLGVFEIACLHSQTPYVERFEGSHPSGNSSDRSSVVGPCHGRFKKKKRLENCIQEDGRHLTDIIFKT